MWLETHSEFPTSSPACDVTVTAQMYRQQLFAKRIVHDGHGHVLCQAGAYARCH